MIRVCIAAAALLAPLALTTPAAAQSQADLDARYDRALAAGYKALFLCGAISSAERAGTTRTPESVGRWELTGVQEPLDTLIESLPPARSVRDGVNGPLRSVSVSFADDMPPRTAVHRNGAGCSILPIGLQDIPAAEQQPTPAGTTPANEASDPTVASSEMAQTGFDQRYGADARTTAVIIARDGDILSEAYAQDFGPDVPQRTWSVAKSIAATLIGAAVQRGEADVAASAGLGAGEGDPRAAITIDHLLRMASGRYTDTPGNRTDPLYYGGATVDESATHWPLIAQPGTVFRYANNDTLLAIEAISDTFAQHPPAELFATLGMDRTVAETDWQGDYILSSQVWTTARDLAKLGQLYLQDGMWDGERVLPEGWARYVSAPTGPQPDGEWGYGAGWWIMSGMDGIPDDAFAARGNRGQNLVIIPSRDIVIVRRGEDPAGGAGFDIAAFTRDVLARMED